MSETKAKHFLVTVWNDIEPDCEGPFGTEEERDQRAKDFREEQGDRHGIYWLDIKGDKIEIGAYSGKFFEGSPEEEPPEPEQCLRKYLEREEI